LLNAVRTIGSGEPDSLLRQVSEGAARFGRAAFRQPSRPADLRTCLPRCLGPLDGTLQDDPQRVPPESRQPQRPGIHRPANGTVLFWRRRGLAAGVRPSQEKSLVRNGRVKMPGPPLGVEAWAFRPTVSTARLPSHYP